MLAFIATVYRYNYANIRLEAKIVLFGETEENIEEAVQCLFPGHSVSEIERAPWLDNK